MSVPFPSPTLPLESRAQVLLGYLDYFRSAVVAKLNGLDDQALREPALPSGWSPIELLKHLNAMERRWLVWGFAGSTVDDPWVDVRDGRWHVNPDETLAELIDLLHDGGERTRQIVQSTSLDEIGAPGERWDGASPASLERVLLHVLQEYARHAGHLDVVRELIDGRVGE